MTDLSETLRVTHLDVPPLEAPPHALAGASDASVTLRTAVYDPTTCLCVAAIPPETAQDEVHVLLAVDRVVCCVVRPSAPRVASSVCPCLTRCLSPGSATIRAPHAFRKSDTHGCDAQRCAFARTTSHLHTNGSMGRCKLCCHGTSSGARKGNHTPQQTAHLAGAHSRTVPT